MKISVKIGNSGTAEALLEPFRKLYPQNPWHELLGPLGYRLTFERIKRQRSVDQNARYWVIVSALADSCGYTNDEMHDELLCEIYGYELKLFRGFERKRPNKRSSKLTTDEFSLLMDLAERWAAEQNVAWDRDAA